MTVSELPKSFLATGNPWLIPEINFNIILTPRAACQPVS